MNRAIMLLLVLSAFASLIALMIFTAPRKGDVIVIDCRLAEISPDFTTKMREACRQAMLNSVK